MEEKLKILFLNHNVVGEGTFLRCYHLARHLAKMNCRVDLSCTNREKGVFKIIRRQEEKNFRLILLPEIARTPSYPGCFWRAIMNMIWVSTNRRKYDLIHAFSVAIPSTGFPALWARRVGFPGIFLDWDDKWGDGLGQHLSPWAHQLVRWCERNIPPRVRPAGITVVSDFLREESFRMGFSEERVIKIINGAPDERVFPVDKNQARKELGLPAREKILVSMGRMFDRSLDLLLGSFAGVLESEPETRLYVVGDLCRYGALKKLIRDIKGKYRHLGERLIFTGGKSYPELNNYLNAADVLVLPMHASDSDRARFPMRVGDYLASGRPIASDAVGEVKRIFEEHACALVSAVDDSAALAANIVRLLRDEALGKGLAENALKVCRSEMNWKQLAGSLLRFYHLRLRQVAAPG